MDWMPTPSPPLHSLHASDPAHWQDAQPPKESHPDDDRVSGELEMFRESRDSWEENWFEVQESTSRLGYWKKTKPTETFFVDFATMHDVTPRADRELEFAYTQNKPKTMRLRAKTQAERNKWAVALLTKATGRPEAPPDAPSGHDRA